MELDKVKALIDTYYKAGRDRDETVRIVSAIPIDGEESEAFDYVDLLYQKAAETVTEPDYLTDLGNAERLVKPRFVKRKKA